MPTKKTTTKKSNFEKNFDDVKKTTKTTAKKVEAESKKVISGVGSWWSMATEEEKIYMVLGIILLVIGLYVLRTIVGGLLLIVIGLLFVTGFFVKKKHK